MLTHTRAVVPADDTEFGDMNGFICTVETVGTLTWTLWNPDANDATVRTFPMLAGTVPLNVFIPLAVKKVAATTPDDLTDIIVFGV